MPGPLFVAQRVHSTTCFVQRPLQPALRWLARVRRCLWRGHTDGDECLPEERWKVLMCWILPESFQNHVRGRGLDQILPCSDEESGVLAAAPGSPHVGLERRCKIS